MYFITILFSLPILCSNILKKKKKKRKKSLYVLSKPFFNVPIMINQNIFTTVFFLDLERSEENNVSFRIFWWTTSTSIFLLFHKLLGDTFLRICFLMCDRNKLRHSISLEKLWQFVLQDNISALTDSTKYKETKPFLGKTGKWCKSQLCYL